MFVNFMASTTGRIVRVVAGIILIGLGLFVMESPGGWIVAIIGVVPLAAGLLDVCLVAPLLGAALSGKRIRGEK